MSSDGEIRLWADVVRQAFNDLMAPMAITAKTQRRSVDITWERAADAYDFFVTPGRLEPIARVIGLDANAARASIRGKHKQCYSFVPSNLCRTTTTQRSSNNGYKKTASGGCVTDP